MKSLTTIVLLALTEPPQAGPPLNYFVYPYVEVDGTPVTDLKPSVRFERLPGAGA